MRYLGEFLFWFLYFPLVRFLAMIFFWHSKIHTRVLFEKRNKFESLAHSFKEIGVQADFCFEFSSEGEFQQVAPLIDDALSVGKKIELVFFSPSVEKTVLKLASAYPAQIRFLRYPLVRIFPFLGRRSFSYWVTAKKLILVRYDLFPEFLLWSLRPGNELKIVWVTFKKERSKSKGPSLWKKIFLKYSKAVIYAGEDDLKQGSHLGLVGETYDFRIEQIYRRMSRREEKWSTAFPLYPQFKDLLMSYPRQKRLIVGNAWPSDLFLLKDLPPDVFLVVVPHKLDENILSVFRKVLGQLGRMPIEINDQSDSVTPNPTILMNKKGILCELYTDFDYAYVGGGFEGSIHSVLEPLVAGSRYLSCGPAHHRSTEFDMALSMERITEVTTSSDFHEWLSLETQETQQDKLNSIIKDYKRVREFVISC